MLQLAAPPGDQPFAKSALRVIPEASISILSLLETGKQVPVVSFLIWVMSWGSPTLGAKFLYLSGQS